MTTVGVDTGPDGPSSGLDRWRPAPARTLGVILAIVVGLGLALQGRVNGELSVQLADSLLAAVISFGGGLTLLVLGYLVSTRMRAGVRRVRTALRDRKLRVWQCLGGIGGAGFVAAQSITVGLIGVSLFTVGVVAGQTVAGLFVDKAGLGPGGRQAPSWQRVLGALLSLLGVLGAVSGSLGGAEGERLLLLALPLVAGVGVAVQQAINGHVGVAAGSPFTASLVNFAVGTVALVLGWGIALLVRGGPSGVPGNVLLYLGGLIGIFVIALAALIVKLTGVLVFGMATIAGQLIGSMLLDAFLPVAGEHLEAATVLGCAIALVAVLVAAVGGAARRRGRGLEQSDV